MTNLQTPEPGDIVLIRFPFTNLKSIKVRPALLIQSNGEDILTVPISTKVNADRNDYLLRKDDYKGKELPTASCIRYRKLFTLNTSLIQKKYSGITRETLTVLRSKIAEFVRQNKE